MKHYFEIRPGMVVMRGGVRQLLIGAYEFNREEAKRLHAALGSWLQFGNFPDESDLDPRAVAELDGAKE